MKQSICLLWRKLFYSPYFFTIALRRRRNKDIITSMQFDAEYVIPATFKNWVADPILVDDHGKTYMFYEAVSGSKGRIEVVQILDDCTITQPTVLLEDDCHYSYPFVFKHNQDWFMIPETSASNEVRLYRAADFPEKWERISVLLKKKAVDTTVFVYSDVMYLLTYLLNPGTERVTPAAYRMNWLDGVPELEPIAWENPNGLECRGAGPLFQAAENLIRPAQQNEAQLYGNAVLFYAAKPKWDAYREEKIGRLSPEQVKVKNVWCDGLHTYTISEKFEAIDIRCREFELGKVIRVLRTKLLGC